MSSPGPCGLVQNPETKAELTLLGYLICDPCSPVGKLAGGRVLSLRFEIVVHRVMPWIPEPRILLLGMIVDALVPWASGGRFETRHAGHGRTCRYAHGDSVGCVECSK